MPSIEENFVAICSNEKKFENHYTILDVDKGEGQFKRCSKCKGPTIKHEKERND